MIFFSQIFAWKMTETINRLSSNCALIYGRSINRLIVSAQSDINNNIIVVMWAIHVFAETKYLIHNWVYALSVKLCMRVWCVLSKLSPVSAIDKPLHLPKH